MIINADCLEHMRTMESNSISCIVTDPPYGLGFMGKEWDAGLPHAEIWKEALRIVKPGGHILAFGGTRTYHRLTCSIEDAGWEIRDCLMWIYGSGFPKSHNHFGIEGFGTALKPAYEPIIMAMKPCDGTFKQNAEKWSQAGINIDGCRIGTADTRGRASKTALRLINDDGLEPQEMMVESSCGRWPANVLFDEKAAKMLDEQSGNLGRSSGGKSGNSGAYSGGFNQEHYGDLKPGFGDTGGASRFFYCAKPSTKERNKGLDQMKDKLSCYSKEAKNGEGLRVSDSKLPRKNNHPTVKPLNLMKYLITLVMPLKDGILLDPFAGSGSTILAAHQLGIKAIGLEKEAAYCEIARMRIEPPREEEIYPQLNLFA